MKAHLLLADAAQSDGQGKVSALGLGWSVTSTPTPPQAVVILLRVGWNETNQQHRLVLSLLTADGEDAVMAPGPLGDQPLRVEALFEVGRPPGLPTGSDIEHNVAFSVGPGLLLPAGRRYEWRLEIDGQQTEEWTAPFYVRPEQGVIGA